MSKGMVEGCVEWTKTDTHTLIPFPTLVTKASAIMYAFITFHPFTDGNKRTALISTAYFLYINGYRLEIPDDAPEFTKSVAVRCLDSENHSVEEEITRIAQWIQEYAYRDIGMRFIYVFNRRSRIRKGSLVGTIAALFCWTVFDALWKGNVTDIMEFLSQ